MIKGFDSKIEGNCQVCSKSIKFHKSKIKKYCSKTCYYLDKKGKPVNAATQFKKGHIPSNFGIGELINSQGYVLQLAKEHIKANRHGYVHKHRLEAEIKLGRLLLDEEVIHHIDEVKTNNVWTNLYLFSNQSEHATYHRLVLSGKVKKILLSNL